MLAVWETYFLNSWAFRIDKTLSHKVTLLILTPVWGSRQGPGGDSSSSDGESEALRN